MYIVGQSVLSLEDSELGMTCTNYLIRPLVGGSLKRVSLTSFVRSYAWTIVGPTINNSYLVSHHHSRIIVVQLVSCRRLASLRGKEREEADNPT